MLWLLLHLEAVHILLYDLAGCSFALSLNREIPIMVVTSILYYFHFKKNVRKYFPRAYYMAKDRYSFLR